jgi:RNA polymerase primary sigma factor
VALAFSLCPFLTLRLFHARSKVREAAQVRPRHRRKAVSKTAAKAPAKAAPKAAAAEAADAKKVKNVPVKSSAELIKAADELLKKKPARAKAAAAAD